MHTVTLGLEQLIDLCAKMYEQGMNDFEEGVFISSIINAKKAVEKQMLKNTCIDSEELFKHEKDPSRSAFSE
jgi:hypothetical protein